MAYYPPTRGYNWPLDSSLNQNFVSSPDDPNASANANPNAQSYAFHSTFDPAAGFFPQLQTSLMPEEQMMLPDEPCDMLQHARDSAIDLSNGWLQAQVNHEQPDMPRTFSQTFDLHSPAPTPTRSPSTSSFVFSTANSPGGFGSADLAQIDTSAFLTHHIHPSGLASNNASQPHSPLAVSAAEAEEALYLSPRLAQSAGDARSRDAKALPLAMPHAVPGNPRMHLKAEKEKVRAETQINFSLVIDPLDAEFVRFPRKTLAKPKLFATPEEHAEAESGGRVLDLHFLLVCASAIETPEQADAALRRAAGKEKLFRRDRNIPLSELSENDPALPRNGGEVLICDGCKERERKRYDRKKKRDDDEDEWFEYENERIIMINGKEYKKLKPVSLKDKAAKFSDRALQVDFPFRICCYGRHQEEKSPGGFRVVFTLTDANRAIVAQHLSQIFHITDDHKNKEPGDEQVVQQLLIPNMPSVPSMPGMQGMQNLQSMQNMQNMQNLQMQNLQTMQFVPTLVPVPVMQEPPLGAPNAAPASFGVQPFPYFYPQ